LEISYCSHDKFPLGKPLDHTTDKDAMKTAKCEKCGTINTIALEEGELKEQRIETFLEKNIRKVDQWNNYASKWNNINRRIGGSKEILKLKKDPYLT
jgi:hypothetical protein